MTNRSHRDSAEAARTAAADTALPRVRERELRSAAAYDGLAAREEKAAATTKVRQAETAARAASAAADPGDDDEDW